MEGYQAFSQASLIPSPVVVVGAYKDDGVANFAVAAWAGTVCSRPQTISVSFREATLTHSLLTKRGEFTVSLCGTEHVAQVDYFGTKSGRDVNKAEHVKFHVEQASRVKAPYCTEFKVVYQCKVREVVKLGLHTAFLGEIVEINAAESVLSDGVLDIVKVDPLIFSGYQRSYYRIGGEKVADAFSVFESLG